MGTFITIEGGEGVGKTSLTRGLAASLAADGIEVCPTREPGGCAIADKIRRLFKNKDEDEKILPHTELMLIAAARAQHVQQLIAPALAAGKLVLCDRYIDSTRVYQGCIAKIEPRTVETVIALTSFACQPQLTILLESDYHAVAKRLAQRPTNDTVARYDPTNEQEHLQIRDCYRQVHAQHSERIVKLDTTSLEVDDAVKQARELVRARLAI
ncbi:MAG: dTMP kinase [Pseudomonadota bacterium]|nr:dTMP kinase [Pseudomonadota bacterium]